MTGYGFNEADGEVLMRLAYERETGPVIGWLEAHILTVRDMHALMEFLCRMIHGTFPMALTKGVVLAPDEVWALDASKASDAASEDAARMITVSLNEDWDTLTALISATLTQPFEHHGVVAIELIGAWSSGLHAIAKGAHRDGR